MIHLDIQKRLHGAKGGLNLAIQLNLQKGDFACLYGASGVGKTSTLRMLAGLMPVDQGEIKVNHQIWFNSTKKINLRPQDRSLGYVFQDYALFPNMTVWENLRFALPKGASEQRISDLIEMVELGDLQGQKPATLSGGQQQRVALARALVQQPPILLLDEPFSALDHGIRQKLQDYLKQIHQQFELTTILVSHNVHEITKLANKVIVIVDGKVTQTASSQQVFTELGVQQSLQLKGEIIKIEEKGNELVLSIQIQDNVIQKSIPLKLKNQYQLDQEIELNGDFFMH